MYSKYVKKLKNIKDYKIYVIVYVVKNTKNEYYTNFPFDLINKIKIFDNEILIKEINNNEYYNLINSQNLNQYWKQNYLIEKSQLCNYISFKNIMYEVDLSNYIKNIDLDSIELKIEINFNKIEGFDIVMVKSEYY
jgi:hypothetical protein